MTKNLKAVIFDMDGLFLDSERVYREGWFIGAKALNITLPEGIVNRMAGRSPDANTQELVDFIGDKEKVLEIRKLREKHFYTQLDSNQITLKHYFRALVHTLKNNQVKTVVATTSHQQRVADIFNHFDLSPLFDIVITGDQVTHMKPSPDIYLEAQKQLKFSKDDLLVLEDSVTGASAANAAEIPFIMVPDRSLPGKIEIPANFVHMLSKVESLKNVEEWLYQNEAFASMK
ncbi:MAG TPA: HAD family phosphatase [Tetragenococcus sp.]|nr:HAD family phosphatase [Tetragenococcus sp.]